MSWAEDDELITETLRSGWHPEYRHTALPVKCPECGHTWHLSACNVTLSRDEGKAVSKCACGKPVHGVLKGG